MSDRTVQLDLDHDVTAPRAARRFVTKVLEDWGVDAQAVEQFQLLVSELVSNAVLHGGGPISMAVHDRQPLDETIRIEVTNTGDGRPTMRRSQREDLSGRGLQLVDELASGWGTESQDGRTTVWFDIEARSR